MSASESVIRPTASLEQRVAAVQGASNRLIDVEGLSERELLVLERHFGELARLARAEADITQSHSVEEAEARHASKHKR